MQGVGTSILQTQIGWEIGKGLSIHHNLTLTHLVLAQLVSTQPVLAILFRLLEKDLASLEKRVTSINKELARTCIHPLYHNQLLFNNLMVNKLLVNAATSKKEDVSL
jgi:hypothetical protein